MIMSPGSRKFALTAHVGSSVGWLGAVAAFLVLSIAGMTSENADTVRGAYVSMNLIGQYMIVPLSLAALFTGLIQAFSTPWGLFQHYWVLTKFVLTLVATTLLVMHQFTAVAGAARRVSDAAAGALPNIGGLGTQLVVDAGAGLLVLVVTTVLSVYKPWGRTAYGRRLEASLARNLGPLPTTRPPMPVGLRIFLAVIGLIVSVIVVTHLAGGGLSHH